MKKTIGTLLLLTSAFTLADETPTISVTGTGTVSGKPDTFSIVATVETANKNSQTAISENVNIVNKAIDLLKQNGLKENNIKNVKITGSQRISFSCIGSLKVVGVMRCCKYIDAPIKIGSTKYGSFIAKSLTHKIHSAPFSSIAFKSTR